MNWVREIYTPLLNTMLIEDKINLVKCKQTTTIIERNNSNMKSKYDELCEGYKFAFEKFSAYREECYHFVVALKKEMLGYLGCQADKLEYIPENVDYPPSKIYTPVGALHLDDDSYWHMGFVLTVHFPDETLSEKIRFAIHFKKSNSGFKIKVAPNGPEFTINSTKKQTFTDFFDHLFSRILESYKSGLERFLDNKNNEVQVRPIGFNR